MSNIHGKNFAKIFMKTDIKDWERILYINLMMVIIKGDIYVSK